jgi:hypothetical protein
MKMAAARDFEKTSKGHIREISIRKDLSLLYVDRSTIARQQDG